MKIVRTFHPIGQGAFYTERHKINGKEFNIVYDCGSTTMRNLELERKIKSALPEDSVIDILFISHFHADHINGIEFLKKHFSIKKVVLPLLDQNAKILVKISNFINNANQIFEPLIDNPESYFNEGTDVIFVNEISPDEGNSEINPEERTNIFTTKHKERVSSGTVLSSGNQNHEWLFIPINYKHDARMLKFVAELGQLGLILDQIDTIDRIITHIDVIKAAYKKVATDLNKNSLILFSGQNHERQINTFSSIQNCHRHSRLPILRNNSGCLYMGDIDLKQPGIIDDINIRLARLLPNIGTLQIPHHGSIRSFDSKILSKIHPECTICSCGERNYYGHPSDYVLSEVISNTASLFLVTEKQCSMVVQWR